ncbi:hypothetical protein U1Q18_012961 [Sarracenia purpurea var. burkii]
MIGVQVSQQRLAEFTGDGDERGEVDQLKNPPPYEIENTTQDETQASQTLDPQKTWTINIDGSAWQRLGRGRSHFDLSPRGPGQLGHKIKLSDNKLQCRVRSAGMRANDNKELLGRAVGPASPAKRQPMGARIKR